MSKLFTEILDLLVSFMSAYLTSVPLDESNDCIKIYETRLLVQEILLINKLIY